ncbi:DNA polymerase III subunit delta [Aquibacillus sediminis]|uniref:DNA polymerase III subunit delta n=1 Tax=Aquibacillus sediminis TaxID=2574734 RepID=UPI001107C3DD|nr:DNA polymerase III subunit delta [Aquibacillus sediminis]
MSYFDIINKMKKKQFSPTYLFYGTESYLIQELKQQLVTYGLSEQDRDTNISSYDLEETSIQDVIADVETFPFFGERKLIFAYNPSFLKAKPDKTAIEHDVKALQSYLIQPVDFSILIFIAPYEKLDERKKLTKLLKKEAESVACEPIKEWDINKWIAQMAKELHVTVAEDAFELFAQGIGTDLLMLHKELEKLALYVGENNVITKEVAESLLSHSGNTSGLKLVDAVINKDLNHAIRIFKDLEKANEDAIPLIALLASQFRTILHVKLLKQKGYGQNQMVQQLKVHPFVVKMSIKREKNFTFQELQKMLDIFADTDAKIKQGKVDKGLAFELLLYNLIHSRQQEKTRA